MLALAVTLSSLNPHLLESSCLRFCVYTLPFAKMSITAAQAIVLFVILVEVLGGWLCDASWSSVVFVVLFDVRVDLPVVVASV